MTSKIIRFVTDSTSDIPADLARKHGIAVVPCFINFGTQSYADDGVEITREQFYERLATARPLPGTAAPPPGLCERVIHEAFDGADHLIMLSAPANLSAINNSFRLGSSDLPQDRVTLIDGGTTGLALGWQVVIGAEVAEQTGDVDAVLNAIHSVQKHTTLLAALSTLEYLRHGGRVTRLAASFGTLLSIKPIVEVKEHDVHSVARVRTFGHAVDKLVELTHRFAPLDRLAVIHTNNHDGAEHLRERLADIAPPDTIINNITPVLGVHAGPGALGVAPVSKRWRS
jgi:DegV family protein with EDD domain